MVSALLSQPTISRIEASSVGVGRRCNLGVVSIMFLIWRSSLTHLASGAVLLARMDIHQQRAEATASGFHRGSECPRHPRYIHPRRGDESPLSSWWLPGPEDRIVS